MKNLSKTVTVKVKIKFTANQWQLFSDMEGVDVAVDDLNSTLETSVNEGKTRQEIIDIMDVIMSKHADVGAADTEPDQLLADALDEIFGKQ